VWLNATAIGLDIERKRTHHMLFHQNRSLLAERGATGSVIWDASVCLARFLSQNVSQGLPMQGRRCIELGSGCGVVGITCAKLGGHVCLTDQPSLLPLLRKNALANELTVHETLDMWWQSTQVNTTESASSNKASCRRRRSTAIKATSQRTGTGSVHITELMWGEPVSRYLSLRSTAIDTVDDDRDRPTLCWDYVLASDCVYNEYIVPAFVDTLASLASQQSIVVLAQELRSDIVHACFLEHMLKTFMVWRVQSIFDATHSNDASMPGRSCVVVYIAVRNDTLK
jgi:predicted nicotinamide N-methyase